MSPPARCKAGDREGNHVDTTITLTFTADGPDNYLSEVVTEGDEKNQRKNARWADGLDDSEYPYDSTTKSKESITRARGTVSGVRVPFSQADFGPTAARLWANCARTIQWYAEDTLEPESGTNIDNPVALQGILAVGPADEIVGKEDVKVTLTLTKDPGEAYSEFPRGGGRFRLYTPVWHRYHDGALATLAEPPCARESADDYSDWLYLDASKLGSCKSD